MTRDEFTLTCDWGCKMGVFTASQLEGLGWSVVHTDKDAERFYDMTVRFHSKFILRPLFKKRVEWKTLCFYEEFDDTLHGWLRKRRNRIVTHSGDPSKEFLQIARWESILFVVVIIIIIVILHHIFFCIVFDFMFFNILRDILRDVIFVLGKHIHHGNLNTKNVVIK